MSDWKPTTVVLDSTEITRDWYLQGLTFKLLQYLGEIKGVQVVVPASVIEEVVANHARSYDESLRTLRRTSREFLRLGVDPPSVPDSDPNYRERLLEAFDEILGISVLPWPTVSHQDLVVLGREVGDGGVGGLT